MEPTTVTTDKAGPAKRNMDKMVFMEETHPNKVLEGLNKLRLNNLLCDVIICCGGKEFPCHRNVLASFSPYFEAMFTTGMMESREHRVNINDMEPEEFGSLVSYAYTSTVDISTANVQALLAAANLLNVTAVKEACCRFLKDYNMDEQNCVGIHLFAETHSCKQLEQHSMDYILDHFSDVCHQEEFLSLSVDKLTEILASDDLNAPKEEMVFEAAMMWLNKCPTPRQSLEKIARVALVQEIERPTVLESEGSQLDCRILLAGRGVLEQDMEPEQVFKLIRLPLISPSYLHDVIESVDVVKESQGCQRLISEAKNQHLLPSCHTAQPRSSTVILIVGGHVSTEPIVIVESFDPLTNQRKILTPLPKPLSFYGLVVLGTKVYLAGGDLYDGSASNEMWRYDPPHDSWLQMASMNEARSGLGLVTVGGYVFALGGCHNDDYVDSVERYDPNTNTWQLVEYFGEVEHPTGSFFVALDGVIYFIGSNEYGSSRSKVVKYNPETSVWKDAAPMQVPCRTSTACTLKGRIYFIGGKIDKSLLDKVECYNPKTNQWTMCAPMKKRRLMPGVAVVGGMIYVIGGQEDGSQCTIERYFEQTDTWEIVEHMGTVRRDFCCVAIRIYTHRLQNQMTDEHTSRQTVTAN